MKLLPKNPDPFDLKGCYLAGGAILSIVTRTEVADYDYYPKSKKAMLDAMRILAESNCFLVNVSDRALTFKSNNEKRENGERVVIQLCIGKFYSTAQEIFDSFDFGAAKGAFDCDTEEYFFDEDFWPSVAQKRIIYNPHTNWPIASLLRTKKYAEKGFSLSKTEYLKIAVSMLQRGMPESWDALALQIGGFYGRNVKLKTEGLEYNFENIIKVLEDTDFEESLENSVEYTSDDLDSIINLLELDSVSYIVLDESVDEYSIPVEGFKSAMIVSQRPDGTYDYLYSIKPKLIEIAKIISDVSFQEITYNVQINVVKYLKTCPTTGVLLSGIRTQGAKEYGIGEVTEWTQSPYLFCWPNRESARNRYLSTQNGSRYYSALIDTKDIKKINGSEIQTTKIKITGVLE